MQTRVPPSVEQPKQQTKTVEQPTQLMGAEQVSFVDGRPEVATQLQMQALAANSPSTTQLKTAQATLNRSSLMEQKKERIRPIFQMKRERNSGELKMDEKLNSANIHESGISQSLPAQLVLAEYPNLILRDPNTIINVDAESEIKADATAIDGAIERGATSVRAFIASVKSDSSNLDTEKARLISESVNEGYANNFTNRMIEWVGHGGAIPYKEAGYVVESYGNNEAKARDVQTQYARSSKRPDYFFDTKKKYTSSGKEYLANGLMDATTAREGGGKHINKKVSNYKGEELLNYPYLFETTYADLGFGEKPAKPKKVTGQAAEEFYEKLKIKQEEAIKTRSSLRSAKESKSDDDEEMMDLQDDGE